MVGIIAIAASWHDHYVLIYGLFRGRREHLYIGRDTVLFRRKCSKPRPVARCQTRTSLFSTANYM